MTNSSPRARKTAKVTTTTSAKSGISVTQKPATKKTIKPAAKGQAIAPKLSAKKPVVGKPVAAKPTSLKAKSDEKATALRATKKRAPKDLATQYGESVKTPRAVAPKAAPRKRRNAQSRAKLQAVIAPDDDLMARLARAGAITTSRVAESYSENDSEDDASDSTPKTKRRSRKWETHCGKCGVTAQYSTLAALCVSCGAILVRDLG